MSVILDEVKEKNYSKSLILCPECIPELAYFTPGLKLILVPKQGGGGLRGNFSPSNTF